MCWLERGGPAADTVVVHYDGFGFKYGKGLRVPNGLGLVALQAPEFVDPQIANPGPTEGRAAREA